MDSIKSGFTQKIYPNPILKHLCKSKHNQPSIKLQRVWILQSLNTLDSTCIALNYKGGEWFKEGFHKLFSLEWNSFEKTWFRTQFAKNTEQFNTTPENKRLFRRNNRLFIPVKICKLKLKSLRDREIAHIVYTGSFLNQELHPVFPETTGGIH